MTTRPIPPPPSPKFGFSPGDRSRSEARRERLDDEFLARARTIVLDGRAVHLESRRSIERMMREKPRMLTS